MKVLLTGFDPFGGEKINPAFEVVKRVKENIAGAEIIKIQVPTAFNKSIEESVKKIEEINPDYVLNIGQAGGRSGISVERIGINISDARIPDNLNQQPVDLKIDEKGENAYFSTLPIKAIVEEIRNKNIPAVVSDSAGTYVCNHLLYGILNHIYKNNLNIKAGFIHIPYLFEQVINKPNTPAMDLETMVVAIETAIEVICTIKKDIIKPQGNIC
jgi:pyroglutamyl-peptidase